MNSGLTKKEKPLIFIAAQLQFVKTSDELFSGTTPPEEGKKLFNEIFAKNEYFSIKPKRQKGRQIELFIDPFVDNKNLFLGAKIAKSKKIIVPDIQDKHIVERTISSLPFVIMLWDNDSQILLIQQKTTVFADVTLPIQIILLHLNSIIINKGIVAKLYLIKEKGTFWKSIEQFEFIYSLKIDLTAPNIFGSTFKKAEEFTKALQQETNGTEFGITINNDAGKVKLDSKDELIQSISNIIDSGGGNLRISGIKKGNKKKRKERLNLKKWYKNIPVDNKYNDIDYLNSKNISNITSAIKDKYIENKPKDEDKNNS